MSMYRDFAYAAGAALLFTHGMVAHALFTAPETEVFDLSSSGVMFQVLDGVTPGTNNGPTSTNANLNFDKFNTGLGVLLGVEVTFQSAYGSTTTINVTYPSVEFDNEGQVFTANGSQSLKLAGFNLNALLSTSPAASCMIPVDGSACVTPVTAGPTSFNSAAPIALTPLADFLGPGTFILTATLDSSIAPGLNGMSSATVDNSTMTGTLATNWQGSVSVRYEYRENPTGGTVPEPMTLYLLLAGAAGLAFFWRRPLSS